MTSSSLEEKTASIVKQFEISNDQLVAIAKEFIKLADLGLQNDSMPMTMIPSFVTSVPTGTETGTFLAIDLGGTNFRVCSVHLDGHGSFKLEQSRSAIPKDIMVGDSKSLFSFLAKRVEDFMRTHLNEHFSEDTTDSHHLKLGFTFSFPVNQTATNRGTLLRWTKGFDVADAIGKDVCLLLQEQLDALNLNVHVAALVNDTVGTLMSRAYSSPGTCSTVAGIIIGTGSNGAYVEDLAKITKLDRSAAGLDDKSLMIINTEWGAFDNAMKVLPTTKYDDALDGVTPNPGFQMYEKRVSGMFLGEIVRQILLDLHAGGLLFSSSSEKLNTEWQLDTSFLSRVEADRSEDLKVVGTVVEDDLALPTHLSERKAIKEIVEAVGKRSAYLAGAVIGGILEHTNACAKSPTVDLGVDGSVYAFYPGYPELMREAIKVIIGEDISRVTIGRAEDGSGVGAALCALVA